MNREGEALGPGDAGPGASPRRGRVVRSMIALAAVSAALAAVGARCGAAGPPHAAALRQAAPPVAHEAAAGPSASPLRGASPASAAPPEPVAVAVGDHGAHDLAPEHAHPREGRSGVDAEARLLAHMRDAIDRGDLGAARRVAAEIASTSAPDLGVEREAFAVALSCMADGGERSRAAARRFLDEHPSSTLRKRVRRVCRID